MNHPVLTSVIVAVVRTGTGWLANGWFLLSAVLPPRFAAMVARPLGSCIRRLMGLGGKGELVGKASLVLGPFAGPAEEETFWRERLRHLGLCAFEPFHLTRMTDAALLDHVTLAGEEHLRAALDGGKGAVLFLNHMGNPGALVAAFGIRNYDTVFAGNGINAHVAGRTFDLEGVEALVRKMFRRGRVGRVLLGEGLPAKMAEVLKRNGLFGMFIDFPVVEKHNAAVPFGNVEMTLNLGPALLALRHRVPVLAVTGLRTGLNRHHVTITPLELPPLDQGMATASESLIAAAIARMLVPLSGHPGQWWPWEHAPIHFPKEIPQ